jgi:aryl-alcohol dehydrogenase-like predicted oxidoreductase
METRKLGNSGLNVSPLCLGGNVFGWTIDEAASFGILDAFVAAGFNFVDTADVYSTWKPGNHGGESETIIGNWIRATGNRGRLVLATKVGKDMGEGRVGLRKDYIIRAAEDSLRRLQTDYIDLYQSHDDDASIPLEESLAAFDQLIREGKVRAIGASNYRGPRLKEAIETSRRCGIAAYECLQPNYNLYDRADFEDTLRPVCLEYGIGVIPYYSLASGFLTGKYRSSEDLSKSARGQGVKKYLTERGMRILAALGEVAAEHDATPAKVALAWLAAQPGITAPIASATSVAQLIELLDAARLELPQGAIELLNQASA